MPSEDLQLWFQEYIEAFAAAAAHDPSARAGLLLEFYGVPLVSSRDDGVEVFLTELDVLSFVRRAVANLRSDGYSHTEPIQSEAIAVNGRTTIYSGNFIRRRVDGTEMGRFGATYLIVDGPSGRRIFAIAAHTPEIPSAAG